MYFSLAACSEKYQGSMNLASNTAPVGSIMPSRVAAIHLRMGCFTRRWTAVMLGFLGALIVIRPGGGGSGAGGSIVQWGAVLVLMDALFYGIYQVLLGKKEPFVFDDPRFKNTP